MREVKIQIERLLPLLVIAAIAGDAGPAAAQVAGAADAALRPPERMTIAQSAILGVVEGLTEYLPVSSTGHLILAQRAMGLEESRAANAYAIAIQAGAIAAVLLIYFGRFREMFRGVFFGDVQGRRLAIHLAVAFAPAAIAGLLLDDAIERWLFGLNPVIGAWFAGGLLILAVSRRIQRSAASGRELGAMTWKHALIIGLAQCLAMWPGTSRSLVTILAGSLVGLRLASAVEFSFLLGMITLGAATAYASVSDGAAMIESYGATTLAVGFLTATIAAFIAVKWMVAFLNRHSLAVFGWYRIALAIAVLALVWSGTLSG